MFQLVRILLGVAEHAMHLDGVVHVLEEYPSVDETKHIQQYINIDWQFLLSRQILVPGGR